MIYVKLKIEARNRRGLTRALGSTYNLIGPVQTYSNLLFETPFNVAQADTVWAYELDGFSDVYFCASI